MRNNISLLDNFLSYFLSILYLIHDLISNLLITYKLFYNWYDIIAFKLHIKKSIKIVFRSRYKNKSHEIKGLYEYNRFWYELPSINPKVTALFLQRLGKEYSFLKFKGRTILDIGASFGDTSIYFALNGARKVYAVEPYPYAYKLAIENVRVNKLMGKIKLTRVAAGTSGYVYLSKNYANTGGSDISHSTITGIKTNVYSLKELVKKFKIQSDSLLKIDCEGCEYSILTDSEISVLRKFKRIQIEYHYGYIDLINKLSKAGFTTKHTLPRFHINKEASNQKTFIGYIYATRNKNF